MAEGISPVARHRRACEGFGDVVGQVGERWHEGSPCPVWDARGVLEHVIGFHEVLLLRPLGIRANRPRDDMAGRWTVTQSAIFAALEAAGDRAGALPGATSFDIDGVLPTLTIEVLVHTWDLGQAAEVPVRLDPELCGVALAGARRNEAELRSSGMFGPPVAVDEDAAVQDRLLGFLGRDPRW
ncbi:MAG: maleylpyruvate isomerase family mycothiol-dependent enzyme [Acidimicrobiales bacterium]